MIKLNDINVSYRGKQAVEKLSLSISEGEIYGLLGPNGAGKSTTLNVLLGFLEPDSGSSFVNGINTTTDAQRARKHIGYIPENVSLYPYLSGVENLDYFCKLSGLKYSKSALSEFLADCGLQQDAFHKKTNAYSKGMRQKVGIAIARAKKAKVYLLDEPASGLDPVASNELSQLLKNLAQNGSTVLMVSHDIFRVRETCARIGVLKHGSLVKQVNADVVSANELEEIYIHYMQN